MNNATKTKLMSLGLVASIAVAGFVSAQEAKQVEKTKDVKVIAAPASPKPARAPAEHDHKVHPAPMVWASDGNKAEGEIWVDDHGNEHRVWNGNHRKMSKEERKHALREIEKSLADIDLELHELDGMRHEEGSQLAREALTIARESLVMARESVKSGHPIDGMAFGPMSGFSVKLAPVIEASVVAALENVKDQEIYLNGMRVDMQTELTEARAEIAGAMAELKDELGEGGDIYEYKYRILKDAHKSVEVMEKRELEALKRAEEDIKRSRARLEQRIREREKRAEAAETEEKKDK